MDGVVAEISGGRKRVEEKYVQVESQVGGTENWSQVPLAVVRQKAAPFPSHRTPKEAHILCIFMFFRFFLKAEGSFFFRKKMDAEIGRERGGMVGEIGECGGGGMRIRFQRRSTLCSTNQPWPERYRPLVTAF